MAARTLTAASSHAMGDLRMNIIHFADIDNGDTFDSYIPGAVAYWAVGTDDPTQNLENVTVGYTDDIFGVRKGRFTFATEENNRNVKLYVLSKS